LPLIRDMTSERFSFVKTSGMFFLAHFLQSIVNNPCNLLCQKWGNGVTNLVVLLGSGSLEKIVVRECLQACSFSNCQGTTLKWVIMNVVVSIFADVRNYSCGGLPFDLNSKAVIK